MNLLRRSQLGTILLIGALTAGCGKKAVNAHRDIPQAPAPATTPEVAETEPTPLALDPSIPEHGSIHHAPAVLYTETGIASWYGTVYNNRRASNGEIYDQNGMTAAHKTLPLNSIVRVTNLQNGKSAVVRITDRGPFVGTRIIDLSVAAAKTVGVYLPGTARVRVEVLQSPKDIASGGRWCVQIGAFNEVEKAAELKQQLSRRYRSAKVQEFTGPTGEWLRVRVQEDDKDRAYALARETQSEAGVFVVRLD